MERRIALAANIAIIVVAIAIMVVLFRPRTEQQIQNRNRPIQLVGKNFPVNEPWNQKMNVVLALQVGCHFCAESAPFYKKLVSLADSRSIGLIAILPQSKAVSQAYLHDMGLNINTTTTSSLDQVDVNGTPTLFIVDKDGVVRHVFEGKLGEADQEKVITSIEGATP